MNKFLAVAWDVDGTLVDSESLHHHAMVAGTRLWNVDLSDLPDRHFSGIHMGDVWTALRTRLPSDLGETEWLDAITEEYIADRRRLRPIPGAIETVVALAERGIPQACISNSNRQIVDANLDALGISEHMAFTIALDDVSAGKPDPEPYRLATTRFGLDASSILAVEDSQTGARSALAAGLPVALAAPLAGLWPDTVRVLTRLTDLLPWFQA